MIDDGKHQLIRGSAPGPIYGNRIAGSFDLHDGTISQEETAHYGYFALSNLDYDIVSMKSGYEANGWYNMSVIDLRGERPKFVMWPFGINRKFGIFRNDRRRVVLLIGHDATIDDSMLVRATMSYPWGPNGINAAVERSYGER